MLYWIKFSAAFLQPPGLNIFLFLIGFFFWLRSSRWKAALFFLLSVGGLYAFSIPAVSDYLIAKLESQYSNVDIADAAAPPLSPQAIVALSRGVEAHDSLTLVQYVAKFSQITKLPILVGGTKDVVEQESALEATQVARSLVADFNIGGAIWVERDGQTTKESIKQAKNILEQNNITKIFLITRAWHMEPAVKEFSKQGIEATPVPIMTVLHADNSNKLSRFTPSVASLQRSRLYFYQPIDKLVANLIAMTSEN